MKKEDLFEIFGDIDDKYIICANRYRHSHERDFSKERVIVMDVLVKKKKASVWIAALIAVLIAGIGITAAFLETKKEKIKYNEKKIENYFRENENFSLPDSLSGITQIAGRDEKLYMMAWLSSPEQDPSYVSVYDKETDCFLDVNLNGYAGDVCKLYSGQKYLWIVLNGTDGMNRILRADRATLEVTDSVVLREGEWVSQIRENEDTSADIQLYTINIENELCDWYFCTFDSSLSETSRIKVIDENTVPDETVLTSCLKNENTEEYYLFCEDYENKISMYKYSSDGKEVYHRDDIASDMDGYTTGYFLTTSGNPVVMTQALSDSCIKQFNEFDQETGEVCGRYEFSMSEKFVYINLGSWNSSEKYDVVYISDGKVYGLTLEDESSELVADCSQYNKKYSEAFIVSSGDGDLMISGCERDTSEAGYYLVLSDCDGNILGKHSLGNSTISKFHFSEEGRLQALLQSSENMDSFNIENVEWSVVSMKEDGSFEDKTALSVDMKKVPFARDFAAANDFYALLVTNTGTGLSFDEIQLFDASGKLTGKINCTGKNVSGLFVSENKIYAVCSSDKKSFISEITPKKTGLPETVSLDFILPYDDILMMDGNNEFDVFMRFNDGVYGYRLSDNSLTEFVNWMDSDINYSSCMCMCIPDSNSIAMTVLENNGNIIERTTVFDRVDETVLEKIQQRKLITIAGLIEPDKNLEKFILDYNKNSEEYKIHFDDYSKYIFSDNIAGISSHIDSEIIKGNVPDMILADSRFDWLRYSSSGLFADMKTISENDAEYIEDEYFGNLFDAYAYDGKQYCIPLRFTLKCLTAKKSLAGERTGYTYDEIFSINSGKNLFSAAKYQQLLNEFVYSDISGYVNYKEGTCRFDDPDFISLLGVIKNNGIPDDSVIDFSTLETGVPQDRYMFNLSELNSFDVTARIQQIFVGEEAAFLGYPSSEPSGPLVSSDLIAGICSSSPYKSEVWELIKQLLSDDSQRSIAGFRFPVKRSVFDFMAQSAVKNSISSYWPASDGKQIKLKNIDSETLERLKNTLNSVQRSVMFDSNIYRIINEQAEVFLADGQSAEETARIIQSKVSLYLKEID
ncbi:MAG: extracellular solute-binding protein [Ruminococcus sp.]|nr:extracellular solute-binding protein [Ruminococcus sp.]